MPTASAFGRDVEDDLPFAARTQLPLLITGSRLAAAWIAVWLHRQRFTDDTPFVEIECTHSEPLIRRSLETALDAAAQRGTVVLYNIDALSSPLQHLVAESLVASGWRVVSATSVDLYGLCCSHGFDEQAFYRLNTLHIIVSSP